MYSQKPRSIEMTISKREFYEAKAATYPEVDAEAMFRYRRAIACASLYPGNVVLDIGCKFGVLRDLLREAQQSIEYYGIDISAETISRIADADDDHFRVADVMDGLPFPDHVFDRVFMLEVLEHVENPSHCLREIKRVLNPEGRLILSVPNPYCWNEVFANLLGKSENEGHISAWPPQLMSTLAHLSGFRVESRRGTYVRVPFSRRFLHNQYWLIHTSSLFLARSFIYTLSPTDP